MGDPRRARKKYSGPKHPWDASRINEEKEILKKYGLKNKKEIWTMQAILNRFKRQAKTLIARRDKQGEIEQALFIKKLNKLGLMGKDAKIAFVLGLTLDDVMKLRLQSAVYNKGISSSVDQARQLITHGHIAIDGKKVTAPSYMLAPEEEDKLKFTGKFIVKEEKEKMEKMKKMDGSIIKTKEIKIEERNKNE